MGYETKQVALDFSWPIKRIWEGYLNPYSSQSRVCPECLGTSDSPLGDQLKNKWYGEASFQPEDRGSTPLKPTDAVIIAFAKRNIMRKNTAPSPALALRIDEECHRLVERFNQRWSHHLNEADVDALLQAGRLIDLTHTWIPGGEGWQPKVPAYRPTVREVNDWSIQTTGHDCINFWVCRDAECARLGESAACALCHGDGCLWPSPETRNSYETWEPSEPPMGTGIQMWETVTAGSPVSPVFPTAQGLAQWLSQHHDCPIGGRRTESQWVAFISEAGWAPTFVSSESGVVLGIDAVV